MSYNIYPFVRLDQKNKKGLVSIYLKILEGSKIVGKFSLGEKIPLKFWNDKKREVDKDFDCAELINTVIKKKIVELKTKILEETIISGKVDINVILGKKKYIDYSFFEFAEKQIKEKNYAPETRRNYSVYLDKIKAFRSSLKLLQVNYGFLQSYEAYLRDTLKNEPNTIWGNMKFINTMMNDAIKMKAIGENPFSVYKRPTYKQGIGTFLTATELQKFESHIVKTEAKDLKIVGLYFLFTAYTGLRFSDAIRFDAGKHIVDGERIVIEMQKTKKLTNIFIHSKLKQLIEMISATPLQLTQEDYNRKLKILAAGAGINKKISSHTGRHTFGALLVTKGVVEKVAQGLLGHSSPQSTKIYYHLDAPLMDEAMKKFDK